MSGIGSIQRRAWIAEVRAAIKSWATSANGLLHDRVHREGGGRPAKSYRPLPVPTFTATIRAQDEEAQEADAIVERLIRAHEHGRGVFHGDECCKGESCGAVTMAEIRDQRAKGWPDFHPEDYCHRCGARNQDWATDADTWRAAFPLDAIEVATGERYSAAEKAANGIVCPTCFATLYEQATGQRPEGPWRGWTALGIWHGDECCKPGEE